MTFQEPGALEIARVQECEACKWRELWCQKHSKQPLDGRQGPRRGSRLPGLSCLLARVLEIRLQGCTRFWWNPRGGDSSFSKDKSQCLYLYLSIYPSIHPASTYLPIHPSMMHFSMYLSVCLSMPSL